MRIGGGQMDFGFDGDDLSRSPDPFILHREDDPSTSTAAAHAVTGKKAPKMTEMKRRIVHILRITGGLTDEELLDHYTDLYGPSADSSVRKRRKDLQMFHGLVEDSGKRREVRSGLKQIVWRLKGS